MRKSIGWAIAAAVVSCACFVSSASAQHGMAGMPPSQPTQPSGGARVAVIDIGKIFKEHPRLKVMMNELKEDMKRAESALQKERETITKLEERLREFPKGSQAYNDTSEEITKRQADLTVKFQIQKKQFQQRESKILFTVNEEILQAVSYFCQQHRIDMVMQYSGDQVDPEQPNSVMRHIYRQMVWYAPDLDITPQILDSLKRTSINVPRAADGRAAPPTAPRSPYNNSPLR